MNRIDIGKRIVLRQEVPDGKFVGKLRGMLVYMEGEVGDDCIMVMVYQAKHKGYYHKKDSKYQPIAELTLSTEMFDNAYHVDMMRIDYRFQGHGIAPLLYRYLLRRLGIIIQAGTMQSAGGRKLWASLAKMKDVLVFASYRRGGRIFEIDVDEDAEEMCCDGAKLYDGQRSMYTFAVSAA